jgi:hypothetical protein
LPERHGRRTECRVVACFTWRSEQNGYRDSSRARWPNKTGDGLDTTKKRRHSQPTECCSVDICRHRMHPSATVPDPGAGFLQLCLHIGNSAIWPGHQPHSDRRIAHRRSFETGRNLRLLCLDRRRTEARRCERDDAGSHEATACFCPSLTPTIVETPGSCMVTP